jgi:hypothetical protein
MILSEMGTAVGVDWRQNGDESPADANFLTSAGVAAQGSKTCSSWKRDVA